MLIKLVSVEIPTKDIDCMKVGLPHDTDHLLTITKHLPTIGFIGLDLPDKKYI